MAQTQVSQSKPAEAPIAANGQGPTLEQMQARLLAMEETNKRLEERANELAAQLKARPSAERPMFAIKYERIEKGVAVKLDKPQVTVTIGNSFPVTHGAEKWLLLCEHAAELVTFINEHKSELGLK